MSAGGGLVMHRSVSCEVRGFRHVITWEHIATVPQRAEQYERFVLALCQNNRYIKLFQQLFHAGFEDDVHAIANSIVNIAYDLDFCLPIVKTVMEGALDFAEEATPEAVFPSNSLACKMLECFAFKITPVFLRTLMLPLFERFAATPDIAQETVEGDAEAFLDRLTSAEATAAMPRALRCLCYVVRNKCRAHPKFAPHTVRLVVGPILVRVVMPVLVEPEFYNLSVEAEHAAIVHQRLGVLLRLCQHLSLGTQFERGEPGEFLNAQLDQHAKRLGAWAEQLIGDPEQKHNTPPWPEAFHAHLPSALDFDDLSPLDVVRLHHAVEALAEFVASGHTHRRGDAATMSEINAMLRDCPILETPEMPTPSPSSLSRLPSFSKLSRVSLSPRRRFTLVARPHANHADVPALSFDARWDGSGERAELEDYKSFFFFSSRVSSPDRAVGLLFNVVVRKLDARLFVDRAELIEHVGAVVSKALKSADSKLHVFADLVLDFSYTHLPPRWLHCLLSLLPTLFSELKPEWVSLLRKIYVLNPSEMYFHLKRCVALANLDSKVEVIETRQWKNIRALVGAPKSLHLPDDSAAFIEGSHFAWKQTEQQGSSPPRVLVFGPQSFFEFEGRDLRLEVRLARVTSLVHNATKVIVEFVDSDGKEGKCKQALYDFRDQDRTDAFINDLVRSLVSLARNIDLMRGEETQFSVTKGQSGRKQSRVMVLVKHGLLNLHSSSLRSVLSFQDMKSIKLDDNNPCILVDMGDKQYSLQPNSQLDNLFRTLCTLRARYPAKAAKQQHTIHSDINQLAIQRVIGAIKLS